MSFDVDAMRHANMTHTQMLMWMGQMLSGRRPVYNMGFAIHIDGDIDHELFQQSYDYVVGKSDDLRSVFRHVDGGPSRIVLDVDEFDCDVPVVDFSDKPDEAAAWMQEQLQQYIDIRKQLFGTALVRIGPGKTIWFIRQHHLLCDGWSIGNFMKHVGARYEQLEKGESGELDVPQFGDFVDREITYYESDECAASGKYWEELTADSLPPLSLYGVSSDEGGNAFQREHRHLTGDLIGRMKAAIKNKEFRAFTVDQGLFLLMVTALVLQLRRASGNDRFAIGVCLHHRVTPRDKETIGPFFVFSAMRIGLNPDDTFRSLYSQVAAEYRTMLRHYRHPVTTPPGERKWDTSINFVNTSFPKFAGRDTAITWMQSGSYLSQESLGLQIHHFNEGDGMTAEWDFNLGIFDSEDRREKAMVDFEEAMEFGLRDPDALLNGFWEDSE